MVRVYSYIVVPKFNYFKTMTMVRVNQLECNSQNFEPSSGWDVVCHSKSLFSLPQTEKAMQNYQ